jgi:DNA-binding MarR family transcriptional regulator
MDSDAAIEALIRPQSAPLVGTPSAANALARVKYSHDAMIDLLIANPAISQGQLAQEFGYTQAWVSRVVNSDAFLARLAERKCDLVDPSIALTLDEKFRALANQSLDILVDKLAVTKSPDMALKALELSSKALGYGARQANLNVQQNFVVAMPQKHSSPESWAEQHTALAGRSPRLAAMITDVEGA